MAPGRLNVRSKTVLTVTPEGPEVAKHKDRVHLLSALDTRTVPSHLPFLYFYPPPPQPGAGCSRDESGAGPTSQPQGLQGPGESPGECAAPISSGAPQGSAALPLAGQSLEEVVGVLRPSLARALGLYYPLAGRLVWAGMDGLAYRMGIHCSHAGVSLTAVEVEESMRGSLGDDWRRDLESMPQGLTNGPPPRLMPNTWDPLMSAQVTRFSCGGFVVAVTFHHHVTDGSGFFNFMAAWSALAREEQRLRCTAGLPPPPGAGPTPLGPPTTQSQGQVPAAEGPTPGGNPEERTAAVEREGEGVQGSASGVPQEFLPLPSLACGASDLVPFLPRHDRQGLLSRASSRFPHTCTLDDLRGRGSWLRAAWAQASATLAFLACLLRLLASMLRLVPQWFGHPAVSCGVHRITGRQLRALKGLVMAASAPPRQLSSPPPLAQGMELPASSPPQVAQDSTTEESYAQEPSSKATDPHRTSTTSYDGVSGGLPFLASFPALPHSVSAPLLGERPASLASPLPALDSPYLEYPRSHASAGSRSPSRPGSSRSDRSDSSSLSISSSGNSSAAAFFRRARHMRLGSRSSSGSSVGSLSGDSLGGSPSPPRSSPLHKILSQVATETEPEADAGTGAGPETAVGVEIALGMQTGTGTGTGTGRGTEQRLRLRREVADSNTPSVAIDMEALLGAEEHRSRSQGGRGAQEGGLQGGSDGGREAQAHSRERLRLHLLQGGPLEGMREEEITSMLLFGSHHPTPAPAPTSATAEEGSEGLAQEGSGGGRDQGVCPKAAQRSVNALPHSLAFSFWGAGRGRQGRDGRGTPAACDWASSDDVLCALVWKAITLVRGLTQDSRVAFRRAVEARLRVEPPLDPAFFGNATVGVPETNLWARAGDMLRMPTSQLACFLRGEIQRVDEAYFTGACQGRLLNSLEGLVDGAIGRSIIASSWVKFDIYNFDFGLGPPGFVTAAYGKKPSPITGGVVFQRCGPCAPTSKQTPPSTSHGAGSCDIDMTIILPRPQLHCLEAVLGLLQQEADRHAAAAPSTATK